MSLTISDLFTPDPSGVDPLNPSAPPPAGSWRAKLIDFGVTVNLAVTDWNPGGIARSLISMLSLALAGSDQILSTDLQGGFLDWAAGITDDPASLGTAAKPGWLDALANGNFDVQRFPATNASGKITLTNTSATTYGPFAPLQFHVSNPATGATYSNRDTLTIVPGGQDANFVADVAGSASSSSPNTITNVVTALLGVLCTNVLAFVGANPESNASLVQRCRDKFGSLSPNGPKDAYRFFAVSAFNLLQQIGVTMSAPVTRADPVTDAITGTVTVYVANGGGAVAGRTNEPVSNAVGTPIVLTVGSTTGLNPGDFVHVSGVQGNTAANGFFPLGTVGPSTLQLLGSASNGSYSGGGFVDGGDLGLVDYEIQANCVPLGITERTVSATPHTVTVAMTIFVPAASVPAVAGIAQSAIATYFGSIPIGGFVTGVVTPNTVPIQGLLAAVAAALSAKQITVIDASATLNGSSSDLPLALTDVATISGTPSITVVPG